MRVDKITIEKIWRRFSQESRPPFLVRMDDGDFTAIDLYGGLGVGHILRSDGVVAKWDIFIETDREREVGLKPNCEYEVELDPNWCVAALVIASERCIPELKEVLPRRPEGARHCSNCNGQGFTDLPNAPRFLLCQTCWGLGWLTQNSESD